MLAIDDNVVSIAPETTIIASFLKYAQLISHKRFVCNTFGNIAIRSHDEIRKLDLIYTKHRGISLEEMDISNIVITALETDKLVYGKIKPSIGHQMHREIFKYRTDISAIIHLHINDVISYFSVLPEGEMQFVSNDAALVLGKPVRILSPDVNVELDTSPIKTFIKETNCIIMPHHGITTLGRTLSEAYHRACSLSAEITRIINCNIVAIAHNKKVNYVSQADVEHMYRISEEVIYGNR